MEIEDIVEKLKSGDPLALAKSISIVENRRKSYKQLLKKIYPIKPKAIKIGITGTPGSGKSMLTHRIIHVLKNREIKIGVIAVDPSSPISGGAMLGDRLRMIEHSNDKNVFIRSMASRGSLGGLTASIYEILDLFEAAGTDLIIIETVGVGQSEIDIVNIADVVVMVLTPDAGDEIQILKAGIIEIADIFIVNKSDLGGAEKKILEIKNHFAISNKTPAILKTSALNNEGIDELINNIFDFYNSNKDQILEKKEKVKKNFIYKIVQEKVKEEMIKDPVFNPFFNNIKNESPFETARKIYKKILKGGDSDKKD